jgi:branched-chain amino acid transport system substrate-binding protein
MLLPLFGLQACTGPENITLGASVPLTGNLARAGVYYRDAYQFAVDTINDKGGVTIGDMKYRLALQVLDNQSDSSLAVRQHVNLATRNRVNFLLGTYSSNDVLAGAAIAERYQVPMVQGGGASGRIFSRGYKYVFGTLPPAEDYFRSTIDMLQQLTPVPKTGALISGDDPFDLTVATGTRALLQKAGLEVALHQQYSERAPNFDNILTLIQSRNPDVLLWSGHEAAAVNFIRLSKRRNVSPKLMASFTAAVPSASFRSTLGNDANYAFGMTPWLASEHKKDRWFGDASQFAKTYEEKFGYAPDYHSAAAVATVEAMVFAMEAAGTFEAGFVRDAIAKLDFESLYGRIRFGKNGQIEIPQTVIQIQNGNVVEIFTDRFVNQPEYPVRSWDKR